MNRILRSLVASMVLAAGSASALPEARSAALKLLQDGNFREAYEAYARLTTRVRTDAPHLVAEDMQYGVNCLQRLGEEDQIEAFIEAAVAAQKDNWQLLEAAANLYRQINHYGFVVGGEFRRGHRRGGGEWANVFERDQVRALQLLRDAERLVREIPDRPAAARFYRNYARSYLHSQAWRMQTLTDLDTLPEFESGHYHDGGARHGAPVDAEGNPVFHHIPPSWDEAATDGERWRWLLAQSEQLDPAQADHARLDFARFLHGQFGVQTMARYGWFFQARDEEGGPRTYDLHTLSVDETICQLAGGIRRLTLPEELAFVRILERIADGPVQDAKRDAIHLLAQIFENRRQYGMAVTWWERFKPFNLNRAEERIRQITGNLGQFERLQSQPAGRPATVDFRFRNGSSVRFAAHRVDMERLITDVIAHVKAKPERLDWNRLQLENIGHRLIQQNQNQYLGDKVAEWTLALEPRPHHFDRRITVTTPLREGGVYLLEAVMADGNTSRILVQLDDLVVARKQLDGKVLYYVADAVSGTPVREARLDFFGYQTRWDGRTRQHSIEFREFAATSDRDGQVVLGPDRLPSNYQWMVAARVGRRLAWHGLGGIGFGQRHDPDYNETKTFVITDRPVYRPEHQVQWKAWVRHAKYDKEDTSDFAGQTFWVEIRDPRDERLFGERLVADEYGGVRGELTLKGDAALGMYQIVIRRGRENGPHVGHGSFRVEEYKNPEFEVTVEAPADPVMLGERVEAKVTAKYYFGAPVTQATVKVKVLRSAHDAQWYPVMPWDWFYGGGYWWFGYDYDWYPGWSRWGCPRPVFWWWHRPSPPPELVLETELEIGPDGTVAVPIDTELAKLMHGDQDHRYEITAEVRDQSRRTIVGNGQVLVAREPFKVYAWTDRGHYRVGDTIRASFQARRLDGKPVGGQGRVRLLRVTYAANREPRETEVQAWDLPCGADGRAELQLAASRPGQYRLAYTVTSERGQTIEGAHLFVVRGEGFDGGDYRFSHIELVPDKKEYRPGEGVELMVRTDRPDSTVLLFVRPTNGIYLPPQVLRLQGQTAVVTLEVSKRDMPNFFVEAMTVAEGKLHTDIREIVVPPESRVLGVEVLPDKERYQPGEQGRARIRLTDAQGNPFVGSIVVSVYDKSVEYISGGSNVGDIKSFFWKWRRQHSESTLSNLGRWFTNLLRRGERAMGNLGVFGHLLADDTEALALDGNAIGMFGGGGPPSRQMRVAGRGMGGGAMDGAMGMGMMAMEAAPPAPMMAKSADMAVAAEGVGMAGGADMPATPEVTVRTNFADTALWIAARETDADGIATIDLPMPESLTTWKIRVWAMGHGTRVGEGSAEVITAKDLMIRLQAPRFFVETDEVVLSANIHNYVDRARSIEAILELDGPCLEPLDETTRRVSLEANGELRVDWRVKAVAEDEAVVRMKAIAADDADAMEMRFPVFVHGMDKMDSYCGAIRPDQTAGGTVFTVPEERRPETARLEVRYSPSLAMAMTDALPYLIAYPYGCTEQTLNRFLPAVLTQRTLQRLGVSLADIRERRANLNAQEIGDPAARARQWQRYDTEAVWSEAELSKIVREGVQALLSMQLSDGGWGWFSGYGERSHAHTTAQVVHGLTVALQNDVAVPPEAIAQGVEWLKRHEAEQVQRLRNAEQDPMVRPWKTRADHLDAMVYWVLAEHDHLDPAMRDYLYRDRNHLSLYAKGMFGLALHLQRQTEMRDMIIRNIRQFLKTDDENQTAYLEMGNTGYWWWWYGDEIEAHAMFLRLLAATEPTGDTAYRLVKYLLNNRKHATYWKSTRDTAACIEAFADYIRASGEDQPDQTIQVLLNGEVVREVKVDGSNLFTFDNTFVLEGEALAGGEHRLELRKQGRGPLYWNAYVSYFTLEDFIPKAGLEVKVERRVYRLQRVEREIDVAGSRNQALRQRVESYERVPLASGDTLASGDLIEIELLVESKNDYEYIVIEDFKAAGFEPVDLRSGYTGNALGAYVEFRDERTVFFVRRLMRGDHSVSYRLRAEIPGAFSALPTTIAAMYAPELRGNSDEIKLRIEDR